MTKSLRACPPAFGFDKPIVRQPMFPRGQHTHKSGLLYVMYRPIVILPTNSIPLGSTQIYYPSNPSKHAPQRTTRSWKRWRFSNTLDVFLNLMIMIPKLCGQIWWRLTMFGVGSLVSFGRKMPPPMFVACSTKIRCSQSYYLQVKCGTFHLWRWSASKASIWRRRAGWWV